MKTLVYLIPVLIIVLAGSFFLFNTQIKITEELPLEIIICSGIVIMSLGLITLMVKALNKSGLNNSTKE